MTTLTMGFATFADPSLTSRCALSMLAQAGLDESNFVIVAQGERVRSQAIEVAERAPSARVLRVPTNVGTCRAWNMILQMGQKTDAVFIVGDDVVFVDTDGYRRMLDVVLDDPTKLYFVKGLGFSGFCITRQVRKAVGDFDEGFWPAYFEDNDYHWRAKHAGIAWEDVDIPVRHVGSGSLKAWKEWEDYNANRVFVTNQRRYVEKWGGGPGKEQWAEPWHGCPERAWNTKDWLRMAGWAPPWSDPFFEEQHQGALR